MLLQLYPTICINPHVYLFQKNNELDELLELDNIKYPTESDNKTQVMGVPEDTENLPPKETTPEIEVTKESLIHENKEIALSQHNVILQLQQQENEKKILNELCNTENNINNIANMKKRVADIDVEIIQFQSVLEDLLKKRDDVKKRFKYHFQEELEDDIKPDEIPESEKMEDDSDKLKDIIVEERNKELQRARALKPKKVDSNATIFNNETREPDRPTINRATKPTFHSYILRPKVGALENMVS